MKYLVWGIILLIILPTSLAYYADIILTVDNTGLIDVKGVTDNPDLLVKESPHFTSKQGPYWTLNYSMKGTYENLAYEIHLPQGAVINYLKLPSFSRIEENQGIVITGVAQNTPLSLVVQYQIEKEKKVWNWWLEVLVGLVMLSIFLVYYTKHKRRIAQGVDSTSIDTTTLPPRQATIISLLEQNGGELTQHKLEALTGFPKSSLSRNIASLERKKLVEKFNKGLTNSIRLRKEV